MFFLINYDLNFQKVAIPVMEGILDLHHTVFFFIVIIFTFVMSALIYLFNFIDKILFFLVFFFLFLFFNIYMNDINVIDIFIFKSNILNFLSIGKNKGLIKNVIDLLPNINFNKKYFSTKPPIIETIEVVNIEPEPFIDDGNGLLNAAYVKSLKNMKRHGTIVGLTSDGDVVATGNFTSQEFSILTKNDGTKFIVKNDYLGYHPITKQKVYHHAHSEVYWDKEKYSLLYSHKSKYDYDIFNLGTINEDGSICMTGDDVKNYIRMSTSQGFIHDHRSENVITYNMDDIDTKFNG